ncbi:hypothetical protein EVAR_64387_1 [Eumeta japonica]|uniref:Uncharacterized protein n=1 Tax=Eumeta variegata TaxID=151549 RepID=A0A4C1SFX4_EUMVA|nr:hypothetical protein EVAR_64387_1 [Eumeta japonica]
MLLLLAQKLTKLDEVGYILQLIGNLNKDQSKVFTKIKELEENKICLQAHSKKLRTQIEYTDGLLEQVVEENAGLVQQLRNKGLSEEDFIRELKQTQLINTKDDTIQRLQTALDSARQKLDKIHRSRSPTPSLSEELKSTGIVHSLLMSSAYTKISQFSFSTIDALCDAVKKLYLKKRSLDQLREAIASCKQSIRKPVRKFGGLVGSTIE